MLPALGTGLCRALGSCSLAEYYAVISHLSLVTSRHEQILSGIGFAKLDM